VKAAAKDGEFLVNRSRRGEKPEPRPAAAGSNPALRPIPLGGATPA